MDEPSILDYLKAKLTPWKKTAITITEAEQAQGEAQEIPHAGDVADGSKSVEGSSETVRTQALPWRAFLAFTLALIAQISLEPGPDRTWLTGLVLYLFSAACVVWSVKVGEWRLAPIPQDESHTDPFTLRLVPALVGLVCAGLVFITSGGNRFTLLNLALLIAALICLAWAFWPVKPKDDPTPEITAFSSENLASTGKPSNWAWFLLALFAGAIIFRFLDFNGLPPEMTSDHAEKILDVTRVLDGQTNIFFRNNGGREALHFYLITALHKLLNIELGYSVLKLSTILIGLLALPFLYLVGLEVANRRVALLAVAFAAVAYWPMIISRVGLRLPFYVLFTASTLYFLVRGIRTQNRLHFMLAGISLGLSFYGYSADRVLLIVVVVAVGLYLIHQQSAGRRQQTLWMTVLLLLFAGVILMPLLRYILDEPGNFLFRTLTRMSSLERPLPEPGWQIFLSNMGRALTMFYWDDGEVWLASIPHRPALEWITAALFYCGAILVIMRYIRSRHWLDLFLLLSIPLFLIPSAMALAFPDENPNLYRTGGAIIPVFLMIALSMDGLMSALVDRVSRPRGGLIAWGVAIALVLLTAVQSYNLVFNQYAQQYRLSAWNTSEMGRVTKTFIELTGTSDSVWLIAYPHWADSRLVAINAGLPREDFGLYPEQLATTQTVPGAKLFLVKPEDQASISALEQMYPLGWFQEYQSKVPGKNFLVFLVPSAELPLTPGVLPSTES